MKSREAKLRDEFIAANPNLSDPLTLKPIEEHRQYLENRLHIAFYAGLKAGEELALERIVDGLRAAMRIGKDGAE